MSSMSSAGLKMQLKKHIQDSQTPPAAAEVKAPSFTERASKMEVTAFIREFSILSGAEFPILRSLRLIGSKTTNQHLSATILNMAAKVESGAPLSKAMGEAHWYFDAVAVNIVHAVENSGRLQEGLSYLADLMDHDQDIRDRVTRASLYPVVLGLLAVAVVGLLLLFVVPNFAEYITEAGGKIEGMAAVVFSLSEAVRFPLTIPAVLLTLAGASYGLVSWRKRDEIAFDSFLGRIPIIGRVMTLASLTRFVNMLHMLVSNGIGLLQALELAKGALGNAYLRQVIFDMHASVEQGKSISEPLQNYSRVPDVFKDMVGIGEESGKLPEMLEYLSQVMREEVVRTTDRLTILLQPLMLVFMGFIILTTFVAFFYPYFETLSTLSSIK